MSHERVFARLAKQHGVITRQQALADGITVAQIQTEVRTGRWRRAARGVFVAASSPTTWEQRMCVATHVSRGVASHRSALRLHGLWPSASHLEVTVREGRWHDHRGYRIHATAQPGSIDLVSRDGIACTGLARTLVDVGLLVGDERLEDLVDAVIRDRRLRVGDLVAAYRRASARGRNGCGPMRRLLEDRIHADPVPLSIWSRDVVRLLMAHGIEPPRMEYAVRAVDGRIVAQVDLAYPEHKIAIELDSVRWHLDRHTFQRDRHRGNLLALHGWQLLAFTWEDFERRPEQLVRDVRALIARSQAVER